MNKKILFLALAILVTIPTMMFAADDRANVFAAALSSGYVFKHDCNFKQVYGHGLINVLTADVCYYPFRIAGFGAKASYWRSHGGKTSFLRFCSQLHEVPVTVYARLIKGFDCGLQIYGSLGGGVALIREKSYLGCAKAHKGIGEIEFGVFHPIWWALNVTAAVRYVFPRQCQCDEKIDVGGADLRAGVGIVF